MRARCKTYLEICVQVTELGQITDAKRDRPVQLVVIQLAVLGYHEYFKKKSE